MPGRTAVCALRPCPCSRPARCRRHHVPTPDEFWRTLAAGDGLKCTWCDASDRVMIWLGEVTAVKSRGVSVYYNGNFSVVEKGILQSQKSNAFCACVLRFGRLARTP